VVASDRGHDVGVVLREAEDFVSAAHPGAMLGRPALEQLLEAALRDRQDVQRIPGPEAEPERERAELELRRRHYAKAGAGQDAALGQLDRRVSDDAVRLRDRRGRVVALEHDDAEVLGGEFTREQQADRACAGDGDIPMLRGISLNGHGVSLD
jgi:hypothetical protein